MVHNVPRIFPTCCACSASPKFAQPEKIAQNKHCKSRKSRKRWGFSCNKWNAGVLYLCCPVENRARYHLDFAAATCYIEPKPNTERGRFMAAVTLPTHYRNVFAELGYAQAEIDARIENSCTNDGERATEQQTAQKAPPGTKSTMLSGAGGVVVQFSRSAKTINLRS